MHVGIVGLPNAGKSTLFNALTNSGAETAAYPFSTIDPNQAIVDVPDRRLDRLAETLGSSSVKPATVTFVDIAGLVRGAHSGEGLGNRFLGHIRSVDAIIHVVRAHGDTSVTHPHGEVNPISDIEIIEAELALADLEQAERRLERVSRAARSLDPALLAEERWLQKIAAELRRGGRVASIPIPDEAPDAASLLGSITAKPTMLAVNIDDAAAGDDLTTACPLLADFAQQRGLDAVAIGGRIEAELSELDPSDQASMRSELGVRESGLDAVVRSAHGLLDLITFFTAGPDTEARAWDLRRGKTAHDAAGKIHTDIQRGFVKAEVIQSDALVDAGSYGAARDAGLLRMEGREYVMRDGDVLTIKFTP